jgi:membrane fusion protein (multidrug efflux system)
MSNPYRWRLPGMLWLALVGSLGAACGAAPYTVRGLTEPVGDVELSVPIAGVVAVIHHDEGDRVDAGGEILALDRRMEELEVQRKQVQVETLRGELERSERLFKSTNSIPKEEVEKKRGEFEVAKVELELAQELLTKRVVISPITGIVTAVPVKVGEYCEKGTVLARVVDVREFDCIANIDPTKAPDVAVGRVVTLSTPAGNEIVDVEGTVVFVSPVLDQGSGLLRIRARFKNPELRVRPGVAGVLHFPDTAP